jgi:hypothetical protein
MLKRFSSLLLLLTLSACATVEVSQDQLAKIKRVAIISAIGDQLTVEEIPLLPIVVEDDFGSIADWNIDRYISDRIAEQLKGHYEIVPVTAPINITRGNKTDFWYHDENYTKFALPPDGDVGGGKVDTFILITPGTAVVYGTSHQVHGAYLAHHPSMSDVKYVVGAYYHIIVVDAKTGQPIKNVLTGGGEKVDEALWSPKFAGLTDAQRKEIQSALRTSLDKSLDVTLKDMKLAE